MRFEGFSSVKQIAAIKCWVSI